MGAESALGPLVARLMRPADDCQEGLESTTSLKSDSGWVDQYSS